MMEKLETKNDLLSKLRGYRENPDDENILYKQKIKNALLLNPFLLYAINEKSLESELFDDDGNINWEWNEKTKEYEPLGEWDRYFGETSNIRPFLFIPETQVNVRNFICYQVMFTELPKYSEYQKYTDITFTIFVHGDNAVDRLTGIPRADLIASILRERFNWSNIFGMRARLIATKESVTDNNYITRTLVFRIVDTNGIHYTNQNGITSTVNYKLKR